MDDPAGPVEDRAVPPAHPDPLEPTRSPAEGIVTAFADLRARVRDWVRWIGPARLAAGVGAALVAAALVWWLLHSPSPPIEARLTAATPDSAIASPAPVLAITTVAASGPPTTAVGPLVVHVAGGVVSPGVYELPPGARVADAVAAAGGPVAGVDPDTVNLAAPLLDGDRIALPRPGEAGPAVPVGGISHGADGDAAAPVNVNTASAAELDALPGVGPATAAAIVDHRLAHGPFASVDDLEAVRGIGPAKLDALRTLVTV